MKEQGYEAGYAAAVRDMRRRMEERKNQYEEAKTRRFHMICQKILGAVVIALTVLMVCVNEGDATVALFMVPMGLSLLFSKRLMWEEKA